MAGDDLLVGVGADLSGLQRDFQKGIGLADAFVGTLQRTLSSRDILGDLTPAGRRAGATLAGGVTGALGGLGADIARALDVATPLGTEGISSGRAFLSGMQGELRTGRAVLQGFASGVDLTPIGERAGAELATGARRVIAGQSAEIQRAFGAALVPTNVTADVGRLSSTITAALSDVPKAFASTGEASGAALVSGVAGELRSAQSVVSTFAAETSRSLTAALTIGDVSGAGERAGKTLADAVAAGVAAESQRVRTAVADAITPTGIAGDIEKVTQSVIAEAAKLSPALATEGAQAGQALVRSLSAEVARGADVLRGITTTATVGVAIDPTPIRDAAKAEQALETAAVGATDAIRASAAAVATLDPSGIRDATTATDGLRAAQQEWLKEAQGASVAAQAAWQRQREAASLAAAEARKNATQSTRDAQQEAAARAQVRAELVNDIATLRLYGRTVDATNAQAVAAWRDEAAAIARQAREVGLSRAEMLKLNAVVQQTESAFARMASSAGRGTSAIATAAGPAARSFQILANESGKFTSFGNKLATTSVAVGFGLESIARGGSLAETGIRQVLRAIASLAPFFGPEGFIVAGAAAATAAVIDLFSRSRDEMEKTRKKFEDDINSLLRAGDFIGIQRQLRDLQQGVLSFDDKSGAVKFTGGIRQMEDELGRLQAQLRNFGPTVGRVPTLGVSPIDDLVFGMRQRVRELGPLLADAKRRSKSIEDILRNPPTIPREITGAPKVTTTTTSAAKDADAALRSLQAHVHELETAYTQLAGKAELQVPITSALFDVHERIAGLLKGQEGSVSATLNAYREMLHSLESIEGVQLRLFAKKLGTAGVPQLAPAQITANITKFTVSPAATIPADIDLDPLTVSRSVRRALEQAAAAQTGFDFAKLFGGREQLQAASKGLTDSLAAVRAAVGAEAQAILTSADSDDVKRAKLQALDETSRKFGVSLRDLTRDFEQFNRTAALTNAVTGILSAVDAMGLLDERAANAARGFENLVDAGRGLGALGRQLQQLEDEGKGLGGFDKFLALLPGIGRVASGFFQIGQAVLGPDFSKQNQQILNENNARLADLTLELRHFGDTIGDKLNVRVALNSSGALAAARAFSSKFPRGSFDSADQLDRVLRQAGSSFAEINRLAQQNGIQLLDAQGRVSAKSLVLLDQAIEQSVKALLTFQNTIEDQSFIADARRNIFDVDTDTTRVANDWLDLVKKFAPELFDKFFAGADAATKEGRARIEQGQRDIFNLAIAGKIPEEFLKAFGGIQGFVEFLLEGDKALDAFTDAAKQAAAETVNMVQGFRDFNLDRAKFQAQQAPVTLATIPPRPNPTPIPNGASTTTAAAAPPIVIQFNGPVEVKTSGDPNETWTGFVNLAEQKGRASTNVDVKKWVSSIPR